MPTIYRDGPFRFVIWPADHRPPHVHVWFAGFEAVIELGDDVTYPFLREATRMPVAEVVRAIRIVAKHQTAMLARWEEIHG